MATSKNIVPGSLTLAHLEPCAHYINDDLSCWKPSTGHSAKSLQQHAVPEATRQMDLDLVEKGKLDPCHYSIEDRNKKNKSPGPLVTSNLIVVRRARVEDQS